MKLNKPLLLLSSIALIACQTPPHVIVVKEKDYNAARREAAAKETREALPQDKTYQKLMEDVRNPH